MGQLVLHLETTLARSFSITTSCSVSKMKHFVTILMISLILSAVFFDRSESATRRRRRRQAVVPEADVGEVMELPMMKAGMTVVSSDSGLAARHGGGKLEL